MNDVVGIAHSTANIHGIRFNGNLSVIHVTDDNFVGKFTFHNEDNKLQELCFDLDELQIQDEKLCINFHNKTIDFIISDSLELMMFLEAVHECREVCESTLRLKSLIREVYFSGIYQNLLESDNIFIVEELLSKFSKSDFKIFDRQKDSVESPTDATPIITDLISITCIYCDYLVTDIVNPRDYMIHPYVPFQEDANSPVYMCSICVNNWKDFRDQAAAENMLKLPGQQNEEICALCSDSPSELIMCEKCPRSYCHTCLKRIVKPKTYDDMMRSDDWACMICSSSISISEPLPRSLWKFHSVTREGVKSSNGIKSSIMASEPSISSARASQESDNLSDDSIPSTSSPKKLKKLKNKKSSASAAVDATLSLNDDSVKTARVRSKDTDNIIEKPMKATSRPSQSPLKAKSNSASTESLELRPKSSLIVSSAVVIGESNKRGRKRKSLEETTTAPALDELFYFQQYLLYYSKLCLECSQPSQKTNDSGTDEACFLCKDGGTLIECDWMISGKKSSRCRKVYHNYCLSYQVDDNDNEWYCPRHFCDMCGSMCLAYACLFCPISICSQCPEKMVRMYGHANYIELDRPMTGEFTRSKQIAIACQTCLDMINRSFNNRSDLAPELQSMLEDLMSRKVMRFPGNLDSKENAKLFQKSSMMPSASNPQDISLSAIATDNNSSDHNVLHKSKKISLSKQSGTSDSGSIGDATVVNDVKLSKRFNRNRYDEKELYSTKSISRRRQQWPDEELSDLQAAYTKHHLNLDDIMNDETMNKSFSHRGRELINEKLIELSRGSRTAT